MNAFFSLPLLSYLVIPSFTTYSTSLNLLFFYLTWSTLVLSQPALRVELIGTLAIRTLFYILPSLLFLLLDAIIPHLSSTTRSRALAASPVIPKKRSSKPTTRAPPLPSTWYKVLSLSLLNVLLATVLQSLLSSYLPLLLPSTAHPLPFLAPTRTRPTLLKITTTLPSPLSIAKHLALGLLARDVLQHSLHRYLLHAPTRPALTRLHTATHHAIAAPQAFAAHFDHPLPYLALRFLPTYLPAIALHFHLLTYFIFLALVSLEEAVAYTNYSSFPSSILIGGVARRQGGHLRTGGRGNYGCLGVCDWMMGTSVGGGLEDDLREEWEEHEIGERAEGVWDGVKEGGRRRVAGAIAGGEGGGRRTRGRGAESGT